MILKYSFYYCHLVNSVILDMWTSRLKWMCWPDVRCVFQSCVHVFYLTPCCWHSTKFRHPAAVRLSVSLSLFLHVPSRRSSSKMWPTLPVYCCSAQTLCFCLLFFLFSSSSLHKLNNSQRTMFVSVCCEHSVQPDKTLGRCRSRLRRSSDSSSSLTGAHTLSVSAHVEPQAVWVCWCVWDIKPQSHFSTDTDTLIHTIISCLCTRKQGPKDSGYHLKETV